MIDRIKVLRPARTLAFDGERLTTVMPRSQIEMEHFQRYFFSLDFCVGKVVLDVACGEGYGSSILSKAAREVFGVDCSVRAVEHARRSYPDSNISFSVSRAESIPFRDGVFDVVVSFETLEHLEDHAEFLREIKRVLRPGGVLIISTPDESVYSGAGTVHNPFHLRELSKGDFERLLQEYFINTTLYLQKSLIGTIMVGVSPSETSLLFHRVDDDLFSIKRNRLEAPYIVAIASDKEYSSPGSCVISDMSEFGNIIKEHEFLAARVNELSVYVQSLERIAREREETINRLEALISNQ